MMIRSFQCPFLKKSMYAFFTFSLRHPFQDHPAYKHPGGLYHMPYFFSLHLKYLLLHYTHQYQNAIQDVPLHRYLKPHGLFPALFVYHRILRSLLIGIFISPAFSCFFIRKTSFFAGMARQITESTDYQYIKTTHNSMVFMYHKNYRLSICSDLIRICSYI